MPAARLAVTEKNAAEMLDMRPAEFRRLVDANALPGPIRIAGQLERWRVSDIEAIVNGSAAKPQEEDFEL